MDLFMKTQIFKAALTDVYKDEEDRELAALPKMDLGGDFTEDLTAMLFAMRVVAGRITHNNWDILEFTHVLNTLAVQYLLEDKEDENNDEAPTVDAVPLSELTALRDTL